MSASDARSRPRTTASPEETEALGAELARTLRPGDVVVLRGEVGAGKTTFVRGALRALGVTGRVTSPTFTLARRYEDATPPVSHLDLHRVGTLDDDLQGEFGPDRITFVEWPGDVPGSRAITFEHVDAEHRTITW